MADEKIRMSQVVGVFGPGAMLDLPERSVVIGGIDRWDMHVPGAFRVIEEPRLARLLHQSASRMTHALGWTAHPTSGPLRWTRTIGVCRGHPRSNPRSSRSGSCATPSRATRRGDGASCGLTTLRPLRARNTSPMMMESGVVPHRFASCAGAQRGIFRTSNGAVSSTRMVLHVATRCGLWIRGPVPIRETRRWFASAGSRSPWRSCFGRASWDRAGVSVHGSEIVIP